MGRRLLDKILGSIKADEERKEITTEHGFTLKTTFKTYTLFTSTKEEAKMWVRVLGLIVEMNKEGLLVDKVNPFDFENFL